jgi:hypothetical protein
LLLILRAQGENFGAHAGPNHTYIALVDLGGDAYPFHGGEFKHRGLRADDLADLPFPPEERAVEGGDEHQPRTAVVEGAKSRDVVGGPTHRKFCLLEFDGWDRAARDKPLGPRELALGLVKVAEARRERRLLLKNRRRRTRIVETREHLPRLHRLPLAMDELGQATGKLG